MPVPGPHPAVRPRTAAAPRLLALCALALALALSTLPLFRAEPEARAPIAPASVPLAPGPVTAESAPPIATAHDASEARVAPEATPPATAFLSIVLRGDLPGVRTVRFAVTDAQDGTLATRDVPWQPDLARADFAVPPYDPVWATASTLADGDTAMAHAVPAQEVRLGPGERHEVVLAADGPAVTLRLRGPSPALLPHLGLALWPGGREPPPSDDAWLLRADADGVFRAYLPRAPARAALWSATGWISLVTVDGEADLATAGDHELRPLDDLVGVACFEHDTLVPASLRPDRVGELLGRRRPGNSAVFVTTRTAATATTHWFGGTPAHPLFAVPAGDVVRVADLWRVPLPPRTALGYLHAESAPPESIGSWLLAEALPSRADPSSAPYLQPDQVSTNGTPGFIWVLPPGDYQLRWHTDSGPGPIAVELVRVAPGARLSVPVSRPTATRWSVRVPDFGPEVPVTCEVDGSTALGSARDGHCLVDRLEPLRTGQPAVLRLEWPRRSFPTTITAADEGAATAVIGNPLQVATWVRASCAGLERGLVHLRLMGPHPARLPAGTPVPVLREAPVAGWFEQELDGRRQVVAWAAFTAAEPRPTFAPSGHWLELEVPRPIGTTTVLLRGPAGDEVSLGSLSAPGTARVHVATGTTAVLLERPGLRREIPLGVTHFRVD